MQRLKVHTFSETRYTPEHGVVLTQDATRGATPFATHREDDKGNLYLGHYFETLAEAETDFTHRVSNNADKTNA